MTFAEKAAEILTDPYEMRKFAQDVEREELLTPEQREDEERRSRRRMWAILGTLGGLGALGAGAYYYPQVRDWFSNKLRGAGVETGGTRPVSEEEVEPGALADAARYIYTGGASDSESGAPGAGVVGGVAHSVLGSRLGQQLAHRLSPRAAGAINKWLPFAAENPNLRGVIDDLRLIQNAPETAAQRSLGEVPDPRQGSRTLLHAPSPGTRGRPDRRLGALLNAIQGPEASVTGRRAADLANALESMQAQGAKLKGSDLHRLLSRVVGEKWDKSRAGSTQFEPFNERNLTPDRLAKKLEQVHQARTTGRHRQRPEAGRVLKGLTSQTGADPQVLSRALKQYGTRNPFAAGSSTDLNRALRRGLALPLTAAGVQLGADLIPSEERMESTDPRDIALMQSAMRQQEDR